MTQPPLKVACHKADWPLVQAYYEGSGIRIEFVEDCFRRFNLEGTWSDGGQARDRFDELPR